jgi:hypothetical protein
MPSRPLVPAAEGAAGDELKLPLPPQAPRVAAIASMVSQDLGKEVRRVTTARPLMQSVLIDYPLSRSCQRDLRANIAFGFRRDQKRARVY